ncbi:MAG: ATP-binding protein [Christensenellaceae bacterium]|jgi:DNA replication protein DnaC|nr:ATP-binding protein [Christensenellaceae bacterium]
MSVIRRGRVLRDILEDKRRLKQAAEFAAEQRRLEIAQKAPLYADLSGEIAHIFIELSREAALRPGDADALNRSAHARVVDLRRRAEAELSAAGYSPADLEPNYACPLCRDTGFVGEVEKDRCSCIRQELNRRLYDEAGVAGQTFEQFDLGLFSIEPSLSGQSQRAFMEQARDFGLRFARSFPNNARKTLLFTGLPGLGKTFLLNAIAAEVLTRGFGVMRLSAYRMFEIMRKTHRGQDEGEMNDMLTAELLTLDDLGTEPLMENITVEYLFTLLAERKNHGLSTIIATNLGLRELSQRYTERVASRLSDRSSTLVLHFEGGDLRRGQPGG